MKRIVILVFCILAYSAMNAQKMGQQKVRAYKISFITNAIDLTPDEAEKFWPIYNKYSTKLQADRTQLERNHKEMMRNGGIDELSEEKAQNHVATMIRLEEEVASTRTAMVNDLSNIISTKKILKLLKAERDFNRRMLQEFGKRRQLKRQ